jgi:hypothetical protein
MFVNASQRGCLMSRLSVAEWHGFGVKGVKNKKVFF